MSSSRKSPKVSCEYCGKKVNIKNHKCEKIDIKDTDKHKKDKAQEKYLDKIPAGVYCVKELNSIIYIGESSKPQRRYYGHFAKQGGQEDNISAINNYIHSKGKDKFTFEMMCFEDNKIQRLQYEKQLQQLYKPVFN